MTVKYFWLLTFMSLDKKKNFFLEEKIVKSTNCRFNISKSDGVETFFQHHSYFGQWPALPQSLLYSTSYYIFWYFVSSSSTIHVFMHRFTLRLVSPHGLTAPTPNITVCRTSYYARTSKRRQSCMYLTSEICKATSVTCMATCPSWYNLLPPPWLCPRED